MSTLPQRWEMPTEPDAAVTHVQDNAGRMWQQPALGYDLDQRNGYWRTVTGRSFDTLAKTWTELLVGFGPLTDASDKVAVIRLPEDDA